MIEALSYERIDIERIQKCNPYDVVYNNCLDQ